MAISVVAESMYSANAKPYMSVDDAEINRIKSTHSGSLAILDQIERLDLAKRPKQLQNLILVEIRRQTADKEFVHALWSGIAKAAAISKCRVNPNKLFRLFDSQLDSCNLLAIESQS